MAIIDPLKLAAQKALEEKAAETQNPWLAKLARDNARTLSGQPVQLADPAKVADLPEYAAFNPKEGIKNCWLDHYTDYALTVSPMTPRHFHESAALWLGSVAIARRLMLPMPFDNIYPNLFILWLADTTLYRKTTALNIARSLVRDLFPHLLAANDTTPEAFLSDLSGAQPSNYAGLSAIDQQSWEKERKFCAQRGWAIDELSGLMAGAGRDYNAGLLESLLRFYDCEALFTRSTIGRGRIVVKNSYLSILGASTPAAMAGHFTAEGLWSNGWWPRYAILTPERRPDWQEATATERPAHLANNLQCLYDRLPNDNQYPEPPKTMTVYMGAKVQETWQAYNRALSSDLLTDDLPSQLWGAYGRLPTLCLKVAMILAAMTWPKNAQNPVIELPHLIRAMTITENWRASAHRAVALATQSETNRLQERILKIVAQFETGISARDIGRKMRDKRVIDINLALAELVDLGILQEVETGGEKAGRPTQKYKLAVE